MVLYTIVPIEDVLEGFEEDERQVMTIRRGALTMEVEPRGGTVAQVMRILSSDPADYLDDRWQPGSLVDLVSTDFTD